MSDKKDKKFSGRKLLYMLFSLLASVCLWMYVSIAEKPDVSMPVSGIQVELSGTDVLADRKLVVTELSHETISIRFIGARSKVVELSNENVYVSLDVSKIDSPGKYTLKPTPVYDNKIDSGSISVSSSSTDYITVTVDNLVEKTVTVRGSFDGEVENDYLAMPVEVSPETITISGPEKIVSEVSYAQATIEYDNLTSSIDEDVQVVLMNSNNEPVDDKLLTLSQDTVNVKMQVDMVKEIPLSINFVYGAGTSEDSGNVVYDIEPATIKISGDATVLNELT